MEETNKMEETTKKEEQTSTQKIGIYLWIWLLLFVLSFFSYMVDWYQFHEIDTSQPCKKKNLEQIIVAKSKDKFLSFEYLFALLFLLFLPFC